MLTLHGSKRKKLYEKLGLDEYKKHDFTSSNLNNSIDHDLVLKFKKEENDQDIFYSELLSIKNEPNGASDTEDTMAEYIHTSERGPKMEKEFFRNNSIASHNLFISEEDSENLRLTDQLLQETNGMSIASFQMQEENHAIEVMDEDPLSIERSINFLMEEDDISVWSKNFRSLSILYTNENQAYTICPACHATFSSAIPFLNHIYTHSIKEGELLICSYCSLPETDLDDFFSHLAVHQDQCEGCNSNLTKKNCFQKHFDESKYNYSVKRDHTGSFICTICKLTFDLSHQLRKHWFKHTCEDEKTHQCDGCHGLFDTVEALKNHVCLKCPVCDEVYENLSRLRSHTRYKKHFLLCPVCTYEFILAIDHEKHMELHRKKYRAHKFYNHCLKAVDGSSFQCEVCGMIFKEILNLLRHLRSNHKVVVPEVGMSESEDEDKTIDNSRTLRSKAASKKKEKTKKARKTKKTKKTKKKKKKKLTLSFEVVSLKEENNYEEIVLEEFCDDAF